MTNPAARLALLVVALLAPAALAQETERHDPFDPAWKEPFLPQDDAWKQAKQELIFDNNAEPETLDPAIMTGVTEHTLALALYEGLVSHDPETLQARPGVALRWEVSDDKKVYTFHLRKDAKWSNGDPLTAEDFAWSWFRCMRPDIQCDYAYLFDCIEGAEEFRRSGHGKDADGYDKFRAAVGVTVVDPTTLRIALRAPTAYFLELCAFETYMPVPRKTIEKHGDEHWTREENWVGNGPFLLKEWRPRQHIVMTPNPHYWDKKIVKLTKITALPLEDDDVVYNKFLQGEVHWIRNVPTAKIDEAKRNADYFVMPYLGSYFYRFNTTDKHPGWTDGKHPLSNKTVRQALSLAVNRETITRDVTRGGQIPATWFCPRMPAAGYEPPKGLAYDPDRARALLAEAGYRGGNGFPKITVFYNSSEDHKRIAERIAQMWKETLGIQVSLQNAEWKVYLKQVELLDYDVARAGWIGDYEDPMTFLDMWLTGGGNNNTGWSSARYDELVRKAMVEPDEAKRVAFFQEAERIVIEDEFPILPIYMYVNVGMRVEGLRGWYENVRDLHPFPFMYFEPGE